MGFAYLTLGLDDFVSLEGVARVQPRGNEARDDQLRIELGPICFTSL